MTRHYDDVWENAAYRCAICQRALRAEDDETTDRIVGEVLHFPNIQAHADEDDRILLCAFDAQSVRTNPQLFSPAELTRLKTQIESLAARRRNPAADSTGARLRAHVAVFQGSANPLYFLKIINDSLIQPIRIEEVWFDTNPLAPVDNPLRPVPTRLDPGETFETWKPVAEVPGTADVLWRARGRLSDGTVLRSAPNFEVAPTGLVADGGTPLSAVQVDFSKVAPDDPTKWDVFISHASEDKDAVARPLYEELTALGLSVWYDEATLQWGESLRRKIDQGVARSAFGIVIISPAFFAKSWTQYELDGIVTRTVSGKQNLLPIWHQITQPEVEEQSPSLADKVALSTSTSTVARIAREIANRVRPDLAA